MIKPVMLNSVFLSTRDERERTETYASDKLLHAYSFELSFAAREEPKKHTTILCVWLHNDMDFTNASRWEGLIVA